MVVIWSLVRRSPAAVVFPAFVAIDVLTLFHRGEIAWRGEWAWTIDVVNGMPILAGPLLAATSAWCVAAGRRWGSITDATPRGWAVVAVGAGPALVWGLVAHGLVGVAALGLTASVPHGGPVRPWLLLVGPIALTFHAALGGAVGFFVPRRAVELLTGPVAFLLGLLGVGIHYTPNFLRVGGVTGSLAGLTWDWRVLAGQLGGLLSAAVLLLGLAVPPAMRAAVARRVLTGVTATGLCLAWLSLDATGDERFVGSPEPVNQCAGSSPKVCVPPSHVRFLGAAATALHEYSQPLVAAGAALPTAWKEQLPGNAPEQDAGVLLFSSGTGDQMSPQDATSSLALPAACPAWFNDQAPGRAVQAQGLLIDWLLISTGQPRLGFPRFERWLGTAAPLQVHAWVRATYAAFRSCDLSAAHPPVT